MTVKWHHRTVATRQKAALNSIQQLQVDSGYWRFVFSEGNINKSKLVPVWAFQLDWSRVMCWVVLFSGQCDFFKKLFNWWNLSCQILRLFHHSLLLGLHFITFSFSITAKFALPLFIYFFIHPNPCKKKNLARDEPHRKENLLPSQSQKILLSRRGKEACQLDRSIEW